MEPYPCAGRRRRAVASAEQASDRRLLTSTHHRARLTVLCAGQLHRTRHIRAVTARRLAVFGK